MNRMPSRHASFVNYANLFRAEFPDRPDLYTISWVGTRTEPLRPSNRLETGMAKLSILLT